MICDYCGKEYAHRKQKKSHIFPGKNFCSRRCYFLLYNRLPKVRKKGRAKYKIYYKKNRERIIEKAHTNYVSRKKIYSKECEWCKKPFQSEYTWQKYCDLKCQAQKTVYARKENYQKNCEIRKIEARANETRRLYNIDYDTYVRLTGMCAVCGFDRLVDLHHIDKNKNNSDVKNLVGLCPNCHLSIHRLGYVISKNGSSWKLSKK